jgi:hypothetical protein
VAAQNAAPGGRIPERGGINESWSTRNLADTALGLQFLRHDEPLPDNGPPSLVILFADLRRPALKGHVASFFGVAPELAAKVQDAVRSHALELAPAQGRA